MEGLYIAVCNNCSVFNTSDLKPSLFYCCLGWPCFIQFNSLFQTLKFVATMTLDFCLHPTYNVKSKDLVNKPALLRATADGRCEK